MAINIKKNQNQFRIKHLFELDENGDDTPIEFIPALFDRDENEDIIASDLNSEIEDEEFELDNNLDIQPKIG